MWVCRLTYTSCCPLGFWEIQCSNAPMVFCLCDSQLERWKTIHSSFTDELCSGGRAPFTMSNITKIHHRPPNGLISPAATQSPFSKERDLKHQNKATKRNEKIIKKRDYRLKDWVPLSYHLKSPSLLKDNQVSGRDVKKGTCDITRILWHTTETFLTLKKDKILSKGYFIPMINNSRVMASHDYMVREYLLSQTWQKWCLHSNSGALKNILI